MSAADMNPADALEHLHVLADIAGEEITEADRDPDTGVPCVDSGLTLEEATPRSWRPSAPSNSRALSPPAWTASANPPAAIRAAADWAAEEAAIYGGHAAGYDRTAAVSEHHEALYRNLGDRCRDNARHCHIIAAVLGAVAQAMPAPQVEEVAR